MDDLPQEFFRGIQSATDIIKPENRPATKVFFPDKRTMANRQDGYAEVSINWNDDETVRRLTLKKYPNGFVVLTRKGIERVNRDLRLHYRILSERQALDGNPHHGNILIHSSLSQPIQMQIAGTLALYSSEVITKESYKKTR